MIVIVPVNRGENIPRVMRMYEAQTTPCLLCLCPSPAVPDRQLPAHDVFVARPTGTIGAARNAGLEVARNCGSDFACFWDDDNYYGPRYVSDFMRFFRSGLNVVSRGLGFVRHGGELYRFDRRLAFFPGHSTAVRVREAPEFPDSSGSEDMEWSVPLMKNGRYQFLDPWHLVYDREDGPHACGLSWVEFMRSFGPARRIGAVDDKYVDVPTSTDGFPLARVTEEQVFQSLESRLFVRRR